MHDSSARVPFIVSWPERFESGVTCDTPVSLVDIAPTFLSAAGTPLSSHQPDGVDLAELVSGRIKDRTVYSQFAYAKLPDALCRQGLGQSPYSDDADVERASLSWYMAVNQAWKYAYSAPDNQEFLFDKVRDPKETRNLAGGVFVGEVVNKMRNNVFAHLREGGETAGIDGSKWRVFPKVDMVADPDAGLLVQDDYTPWTDTHLPGYSPEP